MNEWVGSNYLESNGKWNPNKQLNNWYYDGDVWKFIESSGIYKNNDWLSWNEYWYYFDENGEMSTDWMAIDNEWYYFYSNGKMVYNEWIGNNFLEQNGKWNSKKMKNGWYLDGESWKYIDESGNFMKNDWLFLSEKWYLFDENSAMVTGWKSLLNEWYYFYGNGEMAANEWIETSFVEANGKWNRNKIRYQWVFENENWYIHDNKIETNIKESWMFVNDYWYWFDDNGIMVTDWKFIDGNKYFFNSKGQNIGGKGVKKVIDISEHNSKIDWETVKKTENIDHVILRLGYGSAAVDKQFSRNIAELKRLNIPYSIYLYSYAENEEEAGWEANFTINTLKKYDISFDTHIYYDIEKPQYLDGRDVNISTSSYKKIIPNYINTLKKAGYDNVSVYTYRYYLQTKLNDDSLIKYVDWLAEYGNHINYNGKEAETDFSGWQYSSEEKLSGIYGNVDMSVFF